jgi:exopolysaccharide biosynthesis polyprenyl glycosylphosphotransferase
MFKIFSLPMSPWKFILFSGDVLCYILSVFIACYFNPQTSPNLFKYVYQFKIYFILIGITYLIVLYIADTYNYFKDFRHILNLAYVFVVCWIGTLLVVLAFYFPLKGWIIGRTLLLIQALSFTTLVVVWRFTFSVIALPQRLEKRIMIIGAGRAGRYLLGSLRRRPGSGFLPVGFVDDDVDKLGTRPDDLPVLGDSSQLGALINEYKVNLAVVAITGKRSSWLTNNLIMVSWDECRLLDMPTFYEFLTGKLPTDHISDDWIFEWSVNSRKIYYIRFKRLVDLTLAGTLLLVASPLMLVVAGLIKLDSKGPIFFMQERLGQKGKPFNIIKFRTMFEGAEHNGPAWTEQNDPRITRVGKFIRKLRLDELPQLWNIIRGEMSFIGPRPLAHTSYMDTIDFYKYRTLVKPGITGWAQVTFPEGLTIDSTQEKLKYDLYYIKNIGFLVDLAILLKTVRTVIFGKGR